MRELVREQKSDPGHSRVSPGRSGSSVRASPVPDSPNAAVLADPSRFPEARTRLSDSGMGPRRVQLLRDLQRRNGNQAVRRIVEGAIGLVLPKRCAPAAAGEGLGPKCGEEEPLALERRTNNDPGPPTVPAIVEGVLRSPGQPLDAPTRAFMEPGFGHNFSQVRVHTDARADESVRAVNALAYTVGRDIVFGAGQYQPATAQGRRLLAHELTHVVQQRGGTIERNPGMCKANDVYEREADSLASAIPDRETASALGHGAGHMRMHAVQVMPAKRGIQRWSYGSAAAGIPDGHGGTGRFVPVPAAHRTDPNGVNSAMGLIDSLIARADWRGNTCRNFYGAAPAGHCPSGETLPQIHNRAVVWFYQDPPGADWLAGSFLNGNNLAYTQRLWNVRSRWALAASIIHEYIHLCGEANHDVGDNAKGACGLPNI